MSNIAITGDNVQSWEAHAKKALRMWKKRGIEGERIVVRDVHNSVSFWLVDAYGTELSCIALRGERLKMVF
jgi:hypothetical protein